MRQVAVGRVATILVGALPSGRFKALLMRKVLGWSIHRTAQVGPCIFLQVANVTLGANVHIRSFSAFLHLNELTLGDNAAIGHWNWISAAPDLRTPILDDRARNRPAALLLAQGAAVTSRHYIDCSGGVEIGAFTVLAGVRSTIMSHQVDTTRSEQDVKPVTIGEYCLVGSNSKLVPGAHIPDRCIIAMGSVIVGKLPDEGFLYAGVPARRVKPTGDGKYFSRTTSYAGIPQRHVPDVS